MTSNTAFQSSRRRLVVQLASLVDLLFIILFLQYMQLKVASHEQTLREQERSSLAVEAKELAEEKEKHANELSDRAMKQVGDAVQLRQDNERLANEVKSLQEQMDELRKRSIEADKRAEEEAKRADEERLALGKVAQGMLGVDIGPAVRNASAKEVETIKKQWAELKTASPSAIVQHLRKTAEMQKLCTIWDVHINDDGTVRLRFGEAVVSFRPKNEKHFATEFFDRASEYGEPKSFVLILVTHGDAQLSVRDNVRDGLKAAANMLVLHWRTSGKRFEVATLRFSETPPP